MPEHYIFAYNTASGLYGAVELVLGFEGTGVWAESPSDLADEIAGLWPSQPPVYVGPHEGLGAALRAWLPDVRDGLPRPERSAR